MRKCSRKCSTDIQREGLNNKKPKEKILAELFANGNGAASVWVSWKDKDGNLYGSCHGVHQECLKGRKYTLSQSVLCDWKIHLTFEDEIYVVGKPTRPLIIVKIS